MSLWWRLRALFGRERLLAERREELETHVALEVEAGLARGLAPDEARRQARLRAGLVSEGLEEVREELGIRWLDGAALDLRHAARALRRDRGFGAAATVVLAASVAVTTLIYCLLEGVVLRPLPYAEPARLVRLFDQNAEMPKFPLSIGHYLHLREHARTLQGIALYTAKDVELSGGDGRPRRLTGVAVTREFFAVLGRPPALGRAFVEDELRERARSVIISERLWRDRFGGARDVIGQTLRLDREPWTIVGVAPRGFQHVGGAYRSPLQGESVDVWLPLALDIPEQGIRQWHFTNAVARLAPGASLADARRELGWLADAYARHLGQPETAWQLRAEPLLDEVTGASRQLLWLLVAAGGLVLLLSCANVAGLSVARAGARAHELSLRAALGAGRWQLLRVGLAENVLVGGAGAVIGLGLVAAAVPLLRALLPADFPRAHEVTLTPWAALFGVAIAELTAVVAGIAAAGRRAGLAGEARVTGGREARRLRTALVVAQFAVAGLLCAGSLFLLRSYQQLGARDHHFRPEGALTFQLSVPTRDRESLKRIYEEIRTRLAAIPGVAAAGASTNLPFSGYDENTSFDIVGRPPWPEGEEPSARFHAVSAGFVDALGTRVLDGRGFDARLDADGQPLALLINEAFARRYFPDGGAVGAQLDLWGEKRTIVGVIAGVADQPASLEIPPGIWFPLTQMPFPTVYYVVRAAGAVDPAGLSAPVAAAVHAVDSDLALADVRTLEARTSSALAARRFALWMLQSFAGLALVLAAAGVYALLATLVARRRKELGIRAALGATRGSLTKLVLGDGLKMAAAGAVAALVLIPIGGFLLQAFLFGVRPLDAVTIAGAPLALLLAALAASLGPARSAGRSDPAKALRED